MAHLKGEDLGTWPSLWWLSPGHWDLLLPSYVANILCDAYVPAGYPAGMAFIFPWVKTASNYRCLGAALGKTGDEPQCFSNQERPRIKYNHSDFCKCFSWEALPFFCSLSCFTVTAIQATSILSGDHDTRQGGRTYRTTRQEKVVGLGVSR